MKTRAFYHRFVPSNRFLTTLQESNVLSQRTLLASGRNVLTVLLVLIILGCQPTAIPADWTQPKVRPTGPALPETRMAFDSDRTGNFELFLMDLDGGKVSQLTNDPAYDSWSPRLSPDRHTVLFHRTPAGVHDLDAAKTSIWLVATDGSNLMQIRPVGLDGWTLQGHAEWSPDGLHLVLFGGSRINPQIHLTDALGQGARALTQRPGTNLDPVFHPNGRKIAFVGCPRSICTGASYEIYTMPVDRLAQQSNGKALATRITTDNLRDHDPMWSPDGRRLAWLTQITTGRPGVWDVRIGAADGAGATLLVGDAGVTSRPEFARDGTIFVHRIPPQGNRFGIYRIDKKGIPVEITAGQPGNNEYPAP